MMPSNVIRYRGHAAEIGYHDSADSFHGRVIGMHDAIDFYGCTPEELRKEFKASIEEYLACCKEEGEKPEKTWLGKRRRFAAAAAAHRMSLNAWALSALDRESRTVERESPEIES